MVLLPGCPCCGETGPCANGCAESYTSLLVRLQVPAATGDPWTDMTPLPDNDNPSILHPRRTYNFPAIDETVVVDRTSSQLEYWGTHVNAVAVRNANRLCSLNVGGQMFAYGFLDNYYSGYVFERSGFSLAVTFSNGPTGFGTQMRVFLNVYWTGLVDEATSSPSDARTISAIERVASLGSECTSWQSWTISSQTISGITNVGDVYGNGFNGSVVANNRYFFGTAIRRMGAATVTFEVVQ